jgi:hypothetical protein
MPITIPRGATNVLVQDASRFAVGQKIALGYGSGYPSVPTVRERYEVAAVTVVGKPGTQAYLALPPWCPSAMRGSSIGDRRSRSTVVRIARHP